MTKKEEKQHSKNFVLSSTILYSESKDTNQCTYFFTLRVVLIVSLI